MAKSDVYAFFKCFIKFVLKHIVFLYSSTFWYSFYLFVIVLVYLWQGKPVRKQSRNKRHTGTAAKTAPFDFKGQRYKKN